MSGIAHTNKRDIILPKKIPKMPLIFVLLKKLRADYIYSIQARVDPDGKCYGSNLFHSYAKLTLSKMLFSYEIMNLFWMSSIVIDSEIEIFYNYLLYTDNTFIFF